MTDQERDESFDLAINPDSMELRLWKNVTPGDTRFARYVPHDELVAKEERIKKLEAAMVDAMDQVRRNPVDAICTLRKGLK